MLFWPKARFDGRQLEPSLTGAIDKLLCKITHARFAPTVTIQDEVRRTQPFTQQMEMLYDLQHMDLSTFQVRKIPDTLARAEQNKTKQNKTKSKVTPRFIAVAQSNPERRQNQDYNVG